VNENLRRTALELETMANQIKIPAAPLKMISLLRQPVILSVIFNYLFLSEALWDI
jgi:hypothetical protein